MTGLTALLTPTQKEIDNFKIRKTQQELLAEIKSNPDMLLTELIVSVLIDELSIGVFVERWYMDRPGSAGGIGAKIINREYFNVTRASKNRLLAFINRETKRNENTNIRFSTLKCSNSLIHIVFEAGS